MASAEIFEHTPVFNRLVIKIVPKNSDSVNNTKDNLNRIKSIDNLNRIKSIDNLNTISNCPNEDLCANNISSSNLSVYSTSDREVVLYLGFEESWERDLWSGWLQQVSENAQFL